MVAVREYKKTNVDRECSPVKEGVVSHNQATTVGRFGLCRCLSFDLRETQFENFGYERNLSTDTEESLDEGKRDSLRTNVNVVLRAGLDPGRTICFGKVFTFGRLYLSTVLCKDEMYRRSTQRPNTGVDKLTFVKGLPWTQQ